VDEVQRQVELKHLVEDIGILFEELGMPRMAGRILGWLSMCDPPYQSAAELSAVIGISKGSLSSMMQLLIQVGLVERMGLPQNRVTHYRIKPGTCFELTRKQTAHITAMRQLAERGLALMADKDVQLRSRLEEIRDFYTFFEQEMPALLERWQRQRKEAELCRYSTGVRL